MGIHLINVA